MDDYALGNVQKESIDEIYKKMPTMKLIKSNHLYE